MKRLFGVAGLLVIMLTCTAFWIRLDGDGGRHFFLDSTVTKTENGVERELKVPYVITSGSHIKELVHDGKGFRVTCVTALGNGEMIELIFNSPETGEAPAHALYEVAGLASGEVGVFQTTRLTGNGSLAPRTFNWNSTQTTNAGVQIASAVEGHGTFDSGGPFGSANKFSGNIASDDEVMIGGGLTALIQVTSLAANNKIWITVWWHETSEVP